MSTDYYLIGGISKKEILIKTDIIIKEYNNKEFLVDKYQNAININTVMVISNKDEVPYKDYENIRELTRYGGNNATYIIDTLVRVFNMTYFSDDGFQNLYRPAAQSHDPNLGSNIKRDMLSTHGYNVIDKNNIIIPERTEDDYKPNNY